MCAQKEKHKTQTQAVKRHANQSGKEINEKNIQDNETQNNKTKKEIVHKTTTRQSNDVKRNNSKPNKRMRYIPNSIKREVAIRDDFRCAFIGQSNLRCNTKTFLEFHHKKPFAKGGENSADNIVLFCRDHNQYQGICDFGEKKMRMHLPFPHM